MERLNVERRQLQLALRQRMLLPAKLGAQSGVVLFIALIVLVAMALAGVALVRSVDTENLVSGNMAFKQAALQASDAGIETAFNQLPAIIATHLDTDKIGTAQNYWYYSTTRKNDANGIPTTTPTSDTTAAVPITWSDVPIATNVGGYDVRYVIDRLCEGPGPVADIQGRCFADEPKGGGSKRAGAPIVASSSFTVYYRATVRATGPRNTQSIVQAILGRGN